MNSFFLNRCFRSCLFGIGLDDFSIDGCLTFSLRFFYSFLREPTVISSFCGCSKREDGSYLLIGFVYGFVDVGFVSVLDFVVLAGVFVDFSVYGFVCGEAGLDSFTVEYGEAFSLALQGHF